MMQNNHSHDTWTWQPRGYYRRQGIFHPLMNKILYLQDSPWTLERVAIATWNKFQNSLHEEYKAAFAPARSQTPNIKYYRLILRLLAMIWILLTLKVPPQGGSSVRILLKERSKRSNSLKIKLKTPYRVVQRKQIYHNMVLETWKHESAQGSLNGILQVRTCEIMPRLHWMSIPLPLCFTRKQKATLNKLTPCQLDPIAKTEEASPEYSHLCELV